jgi:hypothetical protein
MIDFVKKKKTIRDASCFLVDLAKTYMAENGGDLDTARALDIHEERVGALNEALQFVLALLM